MCNLTLRHVRATIVAVEKQEALHVLSVCVCVCVCRLSYPACKVHAPLLYCNLWPARDYNLFTYYLKNKERKKGKIFLGKKLLNIKYVLLSSTNFV